LRYLIDSDIAIDYLTGSRRQFQLIEKLMDDGVAMSTISCMELYDGVEASSDPAAETVSRDFSAVSLYSQCRLPSPEGVRACAGLSGSMVGVSTHERSTF
jgi:hypothetical protein